MAELDYLIGKLQNLDAMIEDALKNEVADAVKEAIVESARQNVYDVYSPKFRSRRGDATGDYYGRTTGGITDKESIIIEVHGTELIASDNAAWQQLWGGTIPSGRLAEAIASGDKRYNMQNAGPRPFHEKAKQELISSGIAENALRRGLERQGIDTTGMTFKFV